MLQLEQKEGKPYDKKKIEKQVKSNNILIKEITFVGIKKLNLKTFNI